MPSEFTTDDLAVRDAARRFRREAVDPMEPHVREWVDDHDARFPWEVVEEGSRRGLRTLAVPREHGGGGATVLQLSLAVEEIAAGDMGTAVIFDQTWKISHMIAQLATEEQQQWLWPRFVADDRFLLAIAVAEVEHSTDVAMSRLLQEVDGRPVALDTRAVQDGNSWVLDGSKMMPSLASTAALLVVMAQTEPDRGIHDGCSYFLVPRDTPGLRVTRVWDKISQRLADNAGLAFDSCRIPTGNLLGRRGEARTHPTTSGGNVEAAATTLGSARSAYEDALVYARERIQGGRPIIEHQAVGLMLAQMATELEGARSLVWRAARALDAGDTTTPLQFMAKWQAAEVAVRVCLQAMEVFGGKAILRETPVQKHLRDCLSFLHSDGTQQSRLALIQHRLISDPTSLAPYP